MINPINSVKEIINVPSIKPVKGEVDEKVHLKKESDKSGSGSSDMPVNKKNMEKVIDGANKKLQELNLRVEISFYKDTNCLMIKFIDTETNKVVREYPPEKYMDLIQSFIDLAGLFVDKKV